MVRKMQYWSIKVNYNLENLEWKLQDLYHKKQIYQTMLQYNSTNNITQTISLLDREIDELKSLIEKHKKTVDN